AHLPQALRGLDLGRLPAHGARRIPRAFGQALSRAGARSRSPRLAPRLELGMKALRFVIPLGIFLVLVAFFAVGLTRDPREVPSPFIGKPAPAFKLAQLHEADRVFTPEDMKGKVWLLNVWASWCVSCRVEHPLLVEMAKKNVVPIVGLNYKDRREDGLQWLGKFGNPYALSAYDADGRVGIDYG